MTKEVHFNAPVRNCTNCVHRQADRHEFALDRCVRTGWLCSIAVSYNDECGKDLRYWQAKPPKPKRRSLRRWLMETFWE